MKEIINLKEKTVLIYDYGLFIQLGVTLAKSFKKVYYYSPWQSAYPKINNTLIGYGLEGEGVERINDFWAYVNNDGEDNDKQYIDLYVFPDVLDGSLQLLLEEKLGKRVWGSRKGEDLELLRMDTKEYMKELGLSIQPVKEVVGLDKLREHLKKNENKYIKIDTYRGSFETFHAKNYKSIEPRLDEIELLLGPYKNKVIFIVEDALDDPDVVEIAFDGYCIDGVYPDKTCFGYEVKGRGYASRVKAYKDLSPIMTDFNEAMSETLKKYQYRNFISPEIRVGKDKIAYMIDFCCRMPSPISELYHELMTNIAEILWYGAEGKMINPKFSAEYGMTVVIHSDWAEKHWQEISFPAEIRQWVKLRNYCIIDDRYYIVPYDDGSTTLGVIVAIGNSLEECEKKLTSYCEQVEGYRVDIETASMDKMQEYIKKGERLGIKF